MIKLKKWMLFLMLPMIASCTTVAVSGAGMGIEYTLTNVAYRTFNFSLDQVNQATTLALKKMDIKIEGYRKTEEGSEIRASTKELQIIIDLEVITSKTTKIKVDARKGPILKDKATATEIIYQVDRILEGKRQS